jgi:hypothetical protein
MWVFYYVFAMNSSRCGRLCLKAYFIMIFRPIEQVYAGICHVQVLENNMVAVDSYTLDTKNVVIKLFSDTKQEKIAEPPLSSSKRNERRSF